MDKFVAMGLESLPSSYRVPPHLESEQKRWEFEHKRIEADVELKEEVKHLKSMLEQQAIQMAEQRRHFEEQQASQMAEQRAHYDNMMMQMLSYITSQSTQSSSDH